MTVTRQLTWYFDPVSPYSYLFCHGLLKILSNQPSVRVRPVPILFAGLLNAHGQKGPAEIPSKRKYIFLDCQRSAHIMNVPFQMPPAHPFNPLLALRCLTSIQDDEARLSMSRELLSLCWGSGYDLTKPDTILIAAEFCRIDGRELIKLSEEEEVKKMLRYNTDQAISSGIFGIPSILCDDGELFWGSDRIDHLRSYLDGKFKDLDSTSFKEKLSILPRGADRKAFREKSL